MNRDSLAADSMLIGVPHARGDEPPTGNPIGRHRVFPTRVGMNRAHHALRACATSVFPTRVGMNRNSSASDCSRQQCSPRAWG